MACDSHAQTLQVGIRLVLLVVEVPRLGALHRRQPRRVNGCRHDHHSESDSRTVALKCARAMRLHTAVHFTEQSNDPCEDSAAKVTKLLVEETLH